jgi:TolA-binding protein
MGAVGVADQECARTREAARALVRIVKCEPSAPSGPPVQREAVCIESKDDRARANRLLSHRRYEDASQEFDSILDRYPEFTVDESAFRQARDLFKLKEYQRSAERFDTSFRQYCHGSLASAFNLHGSDLLFEYV